MIRPILFAIITFISGCAYYPSDLSKEDITYISVESKENYQTAYRNIIEGINVCKAFPVAEGQIYSDVEEAKINLYLRSMFGGSTGRIYGLISIKGNKSGSITEVGIIDRYDSNGIIKQRFANWTLAKYLCE